MPLTRLNVGKAISILRTLSIDIYKAANDNHYLTELLNSISPEGRESLQLQYRTYSGNVNGLRNEIATVLAKNNLSYDQLKDLIEKAQTKNPRAYKTIYNNWYSPGTPSDKKHFFNVPSELLHNEINIQAKNIDITFDDVEQAEKLLMTRIKEISELFI